MNWELKLIKDTMMVESMMQCAYGEGSIRPSRQGFTHEEVIAIYIQGIKIEFRTSKIFIVIVVNTCSSGLQNYHAMRGF